MKIFLLCLFLFLIGSMLGYGLEVLFRRFVSAKRWVNPGFMKGPWLPLYGFGVLLMLGFCLLFETLLPESMPLYNPKDFLGLGYESGATFYDLIPLVCMGIAMTILEFLAGLIFVKGFRVKLWDYSNQKGNIMGIICPLFSVIWFAVGVLYYYGIHPFMVKAAEASYAFLFGSDGTVANIGFLFFLGLVYGVMLVDFIVSTGVLNKASAYAKSSKAIQRFEEWREAFSAASRKAKEEAKAKLGLDKNGKKIGGEIKSKINSLLLIDPNKKNENESNYDENGRPTSL